MTMAKKQLIEALNKNKINVSFRIPVMVLEETKALTKKHKISFSDYIRAAIVEKNDRVRASR